MADTVTVTNNGLGMITNLIKVGAATEPHHVGWGIGAAAATVADTALGTPSAEARTIGTSTQQMTNTANDTYRIIGSIVCTGANKAITEIGMFDDVTAGTLFLRGTFSAINVSVGDSISFTISTVFDQV
jgi:hypothetical protein